jgi:hypothetical protein
MIRLRQSGYRFTWQAQIDQLEFLIGETRAEIRIDISNEAAGVGVAVAEKDDALAVLEKEGFRGVK